MKQQIRYIIFFVLSLLDSTLSYNTLGSIIELSSGCGQSPTEEILSRQINELTVSLSVQTLKIYEDFAEQREDKFDPFIKYNFLADKQTYDSISNIYSQVGSIPFTKSQVSLPQFFIINELLKKYPNNCKPIQFYREIGNNYSTCKLCSGKFFSIDSEFLQLNSNLKFTAIMDDMSYLWRFYDDDSKPQGYFQEYCVQAFQKLWNCNNPDDQLQITKIFDVQTQNKLRNSPINGFDNLCDLCSDKFCKKCNSDKITCLSCVDGYSAINGKCIPCSIQNCEKCSKNNPNQDTCLQCKSGFFLYNQTCVKQCPQGTYTGKTACIICNEGQYFNGDSCSNCSNYCKKCSGPSGEQCSECYFGFIKQNSQCSECKDNSMCPGQICKSDEFRTLYNCQKCDATCKTCTNSGPMNCITCPDQFRLVGGRCTNIFYKPVTYVDPKTGIIKQCNFSCSECTDSTNRCKQCNPDLNYYTKDGDRKICYFKCPKNYVIINSELTQDFYECKLSDSYSEDQRAVDLIQKEAEKRCPDYTFWNADSSTCKKCANRCLSCSVLDYCSECAPGYYWDEQQVMCLSCHNSCKKCTGPLYSQCTHCKDVTQIYPNTQGVCDVTAQSESPTLSKVPSYFEIFGDLKTCQISFTDQIKKIYTVKLFQTFSTQDNNWKDTKLISSKNSCAFDDFKKPYSSLKNNTSKCDSISISNISTKGHMTVIYSILLNQSGVKLEGQDANPGSLAEYAIKNSKYSTYYIYKPRGNFSCDRLSCESTLDNFMNGFDRGRNQTVAIKSTDEIVFTSNRQYINCHDSQIPTYDQEPLKELEQTVSQARISVNTNSKVYFILEACITGSDGKQTKKPFLATDFYEKGYVRALDVESLSDNEAYNIFYIQGAFNNQNEYLTKCNPLYKNKFTSYLVTRIKKIEVQHENIGVDKSDAQASQITQKNNSTQTLVEKSKSCTCVKTKEYILQNEGQGGELYKVISPQDTILTNSIKVSNVIDILKKYKLDPVKMKANKIPLSLIQTYNMFDQYLETVTKATNTCYGISSSSNQCIQNVLIDIVFSNNGQCVNSAELKSAASKNEYANLIKIIQGSTYCSSQKTRCIKHVQVLKGCK